MTALRRLSYGLRRHCGLFSTAPAPPSARDDGGPPHASEERASAHELKRDERGPDADDRPAGRLEAEKGDGQQRCGEQVCAGEVRELRSGDARVSVHALGPAECRRSRRLCTQSPISTWGRSLGRTCRRASSTPSHAATHPPRRRPPPSVGPRLPSEDRTTASFVRQPERPVVSASATAAAPSAAVPPIRERRIARRFDAARQRRRRSTAALSVAAPAASVGGVSYAGRNACAVCETTSSACEIPPRYGRPIYHHDCNRDHAPG